MKILVFNGSPKREKSDTLCITRAFLAGMQEAGEQQVKVITAVDQHVTARAASPACITAASASMTTT